MIRGSGKLNWQMTSGAIAILAMAVGGFVYILWRPTSLLMFGWFQAFGADGHVRLLRRLAAPYRATVPGWVLYALPQALWLFSGLIALSAIWGVDPPKRDSRLWAFGLSTMALGFELGQLLGFVPGRFDLIDLGLLITACVAAYYYRRAIA